MRKKNEDKERTRKKHQTKQNIQIKEEITKKKRYIEINKNNVNDDMRPSIK